MTQPEESAPFMEVRPAAQPDAYPATGDVPPAEAEPVYSPLPMYPNYPYSAPPYGAQPYSTGPPYSAPAAYPYGGPPVPPPSRVGLTIGLTAMGLVIGLVLGATGAALVLRRPAGASAAQAGDPQPAGGLSATPSSPGTTPSTPGFGGDLRTLLLPPPRTSHPFAHPLTTDGTLTESQVAGSYTDPERVTTVLEEDGFRAGAAVQWHDADDTEVLIKLFQLGSAEQARAFFVYNKLGYGDDTNLRDQSPIDGIDGSGCWVSTKADNLGFVTTTGATAKDGIYMLVRVYQPDKQNRPVAITIMKNQYARLP
jgi:hypothetical protein